jgi:hypothetical protein
MSLEEEAMRWLYAASLRPSVFAVDAALGVLLAVFLVVVWRLMRAAPRRRSEHEPPTLFRLVRRRAGAKGFGPVGKAVRPVPVASTRALGVERQSVGRP